jgi:hypothetical protein
MMLLKYSIFLHFNTDKSTYFADYQRITPPPPTQQSDFQAITPFGKWQIYRPVLFVFNDKSMGVLF